MTTFYLGFPMRGYDQFNFPAGDRAAAKLRQVDGYTILSPAEHDRETGFDETKNTLDGFDFAAAFAWDLASIEQATGGVIFLPGWERSAGCAAEYAHARSLGRIVYAYRDACDDPDAPYGFKLDPVPVGYTPEVDPLDPNNPEPLPATKHILDAAIEDGEVIDDGFGNAWRLCAPGCELEIVRPGRVQCEFCEANPCRSRSRFGRTRRLDTALGPADYTDLEVDLYDATVDDEPLPVTKHILNAVPGSFVHTVEGAPTFIGGRIIRDYVNADGFPMVNDACDGETRVTDPDTGGEKGTKLARFDLIPAGPLWQLAEHYGKGARKYDDDNWRRGYSWRLSFAALMRHAWAFWQGENIDPETGSHHMTAVAWHAFALVDFADTHPEKDDRP